MKLSKLERYLTLEYLSRLSLVMFFLSAFEFFIIGAFIAVFVVIDQKPPEYVVTFFKVIIVFMTFTALTTVGSLILQFIGYNLKKR